MKGLILATVLAGNDWAKAGDCNKSRLHYTDLQSSWSKDGWNHLYMIEKDWTGNWYINKENGEFVWKAGSNNKSVRFGMLEGEEITPSYVCSLSNTMMEMSKTADCFSTTVWEKCKPR